MPPEELDLRRKDGAEASSLLHCPAVAAVDASVGSAVSPALEALATSGGNR